MTETTTFPAILSVEARVLPDEDGDLSWLGEWREPRRGDFWIDRKTGELHDPNDNVIAVCTDGGCNPASHTWDTFVCGTNHLPHRRAGWAHVAKHNPEVLRDLIRKHGSILNADIHYAFEDWKRAEDYGTRWNFVGVVLVVRFRDASGDISSAEGHGLWGIEDDSGDSYFLETAREQFSDIEDELKTAGFSELEITTALRGMTKTFCHNMRGEDDESEKYTDPEDQGLLAQKAGLSPSTPIGIICDKLQDLGLADALRFAEAIRNEEKDDEA